MDLPRLAFANLLRRTSRSAFLVAALLIGVGTVVALFSITASLTDKAQADLETFGSNIAVAPKSTDVALTYGGLSVGGVTLGARDLSEAVVARIDAIPAREALSVVAPELVGAVDVDGRRVLMMGTNVKDQAALKSWWSVDTGRLPQNGRELIAGAAVAERLGLQMGDYLRVNGRRFTLTGLLQPTGAQDDNLLVAELAPVQQLLRRPGRLTLVEIAADYAAAPVEEVVRQLSAALPDAKVSASQAAVESRLHAVDQLRSFSYAVVAVVVGIEVLVVFITVMGSVSERTHEIGVFRAIGFTRRHISRLILIEAVAASTVAGLLGYLAGMGATYVAVAVLTDGAPVDWAPLFAGAAVVLAALIGALASLYPALHAGRLDPTEALRAL